ncbi:MAG: 2-oxoglutarate dehydrogenase E1 component [Trueperaceae bacterium]|nr:2-oxoglutarate dehydrogenase E1 component [Trueperaceae bacterium]
MTDTLNSSSLAFAEELYLEYLKNPEGVPAEWQAYFKSIPQNGLAARESLGPSFKPSSLFNPPGKNGSGVASDEDTDLQYKVGMIIRNYRVRGHIIADLDPLGFIQHETPRELKPEYYDFTKVDMDRVVKSGTMAGRSLREVFERLRETYSRSIGVQFMHIDSLEVREWLQERMENSLNRLGLSRDRQFRILTKLTDAVVFEDFIQKKYVGVKSFSLTGSESLIPLLDLAVERAGEQGVDEIVFGMAHRGRLNVLANILGKPPRQIFREFDDADADQYIGRGDVKYHLGYSRDMETTSGKKIHLSLSFNPSHLEYVNAVVMGRVRAKQDRAHDYNRSRGLGILIHGDAAFIGEGVVQETLNMSELEGYKVGGILHVILNNQIGFTTDPHDGRSSDYATDVAKMLQSPIFHVNGEDPEAVAQVVSIAMDFRAKFKRDVVIDLYAYRRFGHNESDEPAFTQPLMYEAIKNRQSVREGYLERLLSLGEISREEADALEEARRESLEEELKAARDKDYKLTYQAYQGIWDGYKGGRDIEAPEADTKVAEARLKELLTKLAEVPEGFTPNSKIVRLLTQRLEMAKGEKPLDWAMGEALAFASLATEGVHIRMTGQDVERGTFSHRHAVLHDIHTEEEYSALQNLTDDQARVDIYNSPLSENGVLGFEYGYSLDWPDGLTLWEAQFGDFANSAQVIFDQFISSGEDKWRRLSALVMLLPHGFEGAGPEHSSARLERFLTLCAEDNMQVMNFTTPANYFHALRRQVVRNWRKPMVVMSPKSLLRHPKAVSELQEFSAGHFRKVIHSKADPKKVRRVLLCSGKVYYDLAQRREEEDLRDEVAIIRLEQLYPIPEAELIEALEPYVSKAPLVWVQEEPKNMGAWRFLRAEWCNEFAGHPFSGIYRPESASPATGSGNSHKLEQARLMDAAFNTES